MAKTSGITHRDIIAEVGKGEFRPVYLLMGEESYYIDKLSDYISSKAVSEDEAAFNLITIYATKDMDSGAIVNAAKRYPMMSKYQVVIVKECQNVKNFDALNAYLAKPMTTTVLILCYKNGTMDRRKKTVSLVEASGVVFNSPRLKDGMLPSFISDYLRRKKVEIENQAMMMLVENIGSDLNRLAGELDKLCLTLPQGRTRITADDVERNIGISKNYNVWELKSAVISKDVMKANRIINYFCDNPKQGQPIMVVATLFSFFAGVMQAWYAPDKSEQGLMEQLEVRSSFALRDYKVAMGNYSAGKTMRIIAKLRETDMKLKGIEKGSLSDGDVMRELIFFILH